MEGLVEFHDNIYASTTTTMPPSIAPPSLSPGIGGIIIWTIPLIWVLTELLRRKKYTRRPNTMEIDLRVFLLDWAVIIIDTNDPSGTNLFNLYRDSIGTLWYPVDTEQTIYEYDRVYTGMIIDLSSPLITTLRILNNRLFEPVLIAHPIPGQNLMDINFHMSIIAPNHAQWLFMQNEYGLILLSEDLIIPLSFGIPLSIRINFFGARGGLTNRQMLIRHNINPDLFL
jgi:hypothetical protein